MAGLGDLFITVGAKIDGFVGAMGNVNDALKDTERRAKSSSDGWNTAFGSMQTVGLGMTAAITAPILAIGTLSTQAFNQFELGMRQVTSLLGNATQKEFKDLSDQTLELARVLGIDAVKASKGLYEALSAGVPKENALEFVRVASVAAIAGLTDTNVAVDALTTIIAAYGLEASEAKAISDTMFQAVNIGKFQFADLAAAIGPAAQQASNLGISYTELLGATATLSLSAGSVGQAVTQIESAMRALLDPTNEMKAALKALEFQSGSAATKALGLEGTLEALRKQTGGNAEAFNALFGRIEGATGALGLTGDKAVKAAADLKTMGQATEGLGAATIAANEINKSSARQFEQLQAQVQNVAIKFGQELAPSLKQIVESMLPLLQNVQDAVKWFAALDSSTRTTILGWVAVAVAAGPFILALGTLGKSILAVRAAALLMGVTMSGLMTAVPWVALVASIGLLVKGLYDYKAAVDNLKGASKEQADSLAKLEIHLRQQGVNISELSRQYNQGEISQQQYIKGLAALAKAHGDSLPKIDGVKGATIGVKDATVLAAEAAAAASKSALKNIAAMEASKKSAEALAAAFGELGLKTKEGKTKLESMGDALKLVEREWKEGSVSITAYNNAVKNFNEEVKKSKIATLKKELEDVTKVYKDGGINVETYTMSHRRLTAEIEKLDPSLKLVKVSVNELDAELAKLDIEMGAYSVEAANAALKSNSVAVALGNIKGPVDDYYDSLKKAGITSHETFNQIADDAEKTYEAIAADPRATQWEKDNAMLRMLEAQAEAMRANSVQIPADMQIAMEGLEAKVGPGLAKAKGLFEDFGKQVSYIFFDFARAVGGTLIDALWGNENNAQLDKQAEGIRTSLTERAGDFEAFQATIARQLVEARQLSADEQAKDLAQLRDNLAEKQEAYDEYVKGSSEDLDGVRKERAESLAKELADLREKLSDKQDAYNEYNIDVTEKIQRLTDDDAKSLADQLDNLQDSLRDKRQSYEDFVQDVNTDLSRIGEDLQTDLQGKGTQTQRNVTDKNKDFDRDERDTLDRIERLKKAGKKETDDEIKDLRKALARKKEDRDEYNRRQLQDLDAYTREHQRAAERQRTDLQANLAQRTRDYKEFVTENAANAIDVTVKHKEALTRQVGDLRASLAERAKDLADFNAATALKAEELSTISAAKLAEEEKAIIASLAKKTAEHEKYKVSIALKEEEIRVLAAENLAKQEQDLAKSLAKETADYEKYKSDVAAELQEIKDLHTTIWGDIADMLIGRGGLFAQIADAFVTTLIKPMTDAISDFLSGSLKSLGLGIDDIFSRRSTSPVNLPEGAIPGGSGIPTGETPTGGAPAGDAVSAMTSSLMGWINVISGAVSAISNVIQNFQLFAVNKSLDVIVKHTLETTNEVRNLRNDSWLRAAFLSTQIDEIARLLGKTGSGEAGANAMLSIIDQTVESQARQQAVLDEIARAQSEHRGGGIGSALEGIADIIRSWGSVLEESVRQAFAPLVGLAKGIGDVIGGFFGSLFGGVIGGIGEGIAGIGAGNSAGDIGKIEVSTRAALAELGNLRSDLWLQESHLFNKLDDWRAYLQLQMDSLIQTVRSGGDWLFEVTQALQLQQVSLDTMVAGGATGNITFDLRGAYFLNDRAVDEFMETAVRRMKQRNA